MESKKQGLIILVFIVCAVFVYLFIRFVTEDEEARVRRVVYAGVLAVEKEDVLKCMSLVSSAYEDPNGNDKTYLMRIVTQIFKEFREFKVDIKKVKIEIGESGADSEVSFKCYFKKPGQDQIYFDTGRLKLHFQKEEDRWLVRSMEYLGAKELESLFLQGVA